MTFVASPPVQKEEDIPGHPFWPSINPGEFREAINVDGGVKPERLKHALIEAVVYVNSELKTFRLAQQSSGFTKLADIPDEEPGRLVFLYRRAVYEVAASDLMERYLRFDATGEAQQRAELQAPVIEDHRRNAFWAIRDILGQPRSTVELI